MTKLTTQKKTHNQNDKNSEPWRLKRKRKEGTKIYLIMSNQFEEPDQPMQSIDTIMQIISEATVPAAGTYSFDKFMEEQIYDLESESDAESDLDIDSSGEIVYAI